MAEVKEIREIKVNYRQQYQSRKTSVKTLKAILRDEGYKPNDIEAMFAEQRIYVLPERLADRLKKGQRLFVIDKKIVENPAVAGRFEDLVDEDH